LGGAICDVLLADGIGERAITFNPATQPRYLRNKGNTRIYNEGDPLYNAFGWMASNKDVRKAPLGSLNAIEKLYPNSSLLGKLGTAMSALGHHSLTELGGALDREIVRLLFARA